MYHTCRGYISCPLRCPQHLHPSADTSTSPPMSEPPRLYHPQSAVPPVPGNPAFGTQGTLTRLDPNIHEHPRGTSCHPIWNPQPASPAVCEASGLVPKLGHWAQQDTVPETLAVDSFRVPHPWSLVPAGDHEAGGHSHNSVETLKMLSGPRD